MMFGLVIFLLGAAPTMPTYGLKPVPSASLPCSQMGIESGASRERSERLVNFEVVADGGIKTRSDR